MKSLSQLFVLIFLCVSMVAGCGDPAPRRVRSQSKSMSQPAQQSQKPRYNYEHIIDPMPDYQGLGGGSMDLPGVPKYAPLNADGSVEPAGN
jgi:predicted small lipoprotein YifL